MTAPPAISCCFFFESFSMDPFRVHIRREVAVCQCLGTPTWVQWMRFRISCFLLMRTFVIANRMTYLFMAVRIRDFVPSLLCKQSCQGIAPRQGRYNNKIVRAATRTDLVFAHSTSKCWLPASDRLLCSLIICLR